MIGDTEAAIAALRTSGEVAGSPPADEADAISSTTLIPNFEAA